MSGFTTYKPIQNQADRRAGPPIIRIMRHERGTWIYFTVAIKRTLDISEGRYLNDHKAFIVVKVDLVNNLLAIQNCKEDTPEALRVSGVGSSSQPYVAAGDLGDLYNIPAGRYPAQRKFLDEADTEEAWIIDWTKDLGPGKNTNKKRREDSE